MLALVNEANKIVKIAVTTPNGMTELETISNKVMQGDVLSPLVSSNMVDVNISKPAIGTGNIYMYKNKVVIPPLLKQDDSLAISTCGYKTREMNDFLNTRTNLMCLQYGKEKCVTMHVGKNHSDFKCVNGVVDAWDEKVVGENGIFNLIDEHIGKETMKKVTEKSTLMT